MIKEENWNDHLRRFPNAHVLQSWEWGHAKSRYGWVAEHLKWDEKVEKTQAMALVLQRKAGIFPLLGNLAVDYVPRGPILDWANPELVSKVLDELEIRAKKKGVIFIKMDPEVILGEGIPGSDSDDTNQLGETIKNELLRRGWKFSSSQVQYRNTVWLDLSGSEDDWLSRMKPKTRYNIRLAEKKGINIRQGNPNDMHLLYKMYAETSIRDGFTIRNENYYQDLWTLFIEKNLAQVLLAEFEGIPIAGLVLFTFGQRAWYLFGMSTEKHRDLMPNYLLQWEAMRAAKKAGCLTYDLWGAPDDFSPSDSMWGVYRFKEGLGGKVIRTIGAWDFTARPGLYKMYIQILPRLMALLRKRGKTQTQIVLN